MKTLIKATIIIGLTSMFATSCTAKKQNCDAYGVISKAEIIKSDIEFTVNDELIVEKKS